MGKERELAIRIIDEFEELLDRHGIDIPSTDREGEDGEAHIFGSVYYSLEDSITDIINKFLEDDLANLIYNYEQEVEGMGTIGHIESFRTTLCEFRKKIEGLK